ncbi:hypothetical protein [Oceaniglobus indicus]|nr:hypothetical protein [Oceaniglobus indicus]
MTNAIALWLGFLILCFIGYDLATGSGMLIFLARQFARLVEYIAFWR